MKHFYEYESNGIILKPLERADAQEMRVLRNNNKHCFLAQDEITAEMQEKWYNSYLNKENEIMFKIVKKNRPAVFLGAIGVYDIDSAESVCEVGRFLVDGERAAERGVGTKALNAVCEFCEYILKLKTIKAVILKENTRSLAVSKKVGCEIIGEDDESYYINFLSRPDVQRK